VEIDKKGSGCGVVPLMAEGGDTVGGGIFPRRRVVAAAGGGVLVDEGVFTAVEVSLAVIGGIAYGDFIREGFVHGRYEVSPVEILCSRRLDS